MLNGNGANVETIANGAENGHCSPLIRPAFLRFPMYGRTNMVQLPDAPITAVS